MRAGGSADDGTPSEPQAKRLARRTSRFDQVRLVSRRSFASYFWRMDKMTKTVWLSVPYPGAKTYLGQRRPSATDRFRPSRRARLNAPKSARVSLRLASAGLAASSDTPRR